MTKYSHFPYMSTYSSMPHNTNSILQHSNAKTHYFKQWPSHNKHSTDPHTVTTTDIKTNMCHIHTSIVSRHLVTGGNNKILHTPLPHIGSSNEILPHITCRTLAQLRTNKSPFLKSYLHNVDAKMHPSPLCPLCNIHTPPIQLHPHTNHVLTTGFVGRPYRSDKLAGGP